jgi:hypothetical protein
LARYIDWSKWLLLVGSDFLLSQVHAYETWVGLGISKQIILDVRNIIVAGPNAEYGWSFSKLLQFRT